MYSVFKFLNLYTSVVFLAHMTHYCPPFSPGISLGLLLHYSVYSSPWFINWIGHL